MRDIYFTNISNQEFVKSLNSVKKSYAEINYCLALFQQYRVKEKYLLVQYIYCNESDLFFRLTGLNNSIGIEKLDISVIEFDKLYNEYYRYFISFNPVTYQSFQKNDFVMFKNTWEKIFDFFIKPLGFALNQSTGLNALISVSSVEGKEYIFDFGTVFDLQFRFYSIEHNIKSYVLSVCGTSLPGFAEGLLKLFEPSARKTVILYGFDKHYSEEAIQDCSPEIRQLALCREKLFDLTLGNAENAGVRIVQLHTADDFIQFFKKGWEGYLIQILTHYECRENKGYSKLYFKRRSLRFDILKKMIDQLNEKNELRNDIIIDAVTCTNFFDFKDLYASGIRYMNLSHQNIDTDYAAFAINELYTGVNAKRLNWDSVYFDGEHHLHEARSNMQRVFFRICNNGDLILTP